MANLSNIDNKFLVGTNGEVRIGDTATVANVKLRVKQTAQTWTAQFVNTDSSVAYGVSIDTSASSYGDAGTLQCYTNTGGGFKVQNDGKVGIGTTAPGSLLHIKGETKAYITFEDTTDGTIGFVGDAAQMLTSGTFDNLGLRGEGGIQFGVSNVIKMVLDSSGFVGIGASSPTGLLTLQRPSSGASTDIDFLNEVGAGPKARIRFGGTIEELAFFTGTTLTERMRIDSAGNVGIGTTSPITKLSNTAIRNAAASGLSTSLAGLNWEIPSGTSSQGYVASFTNTSTTAGNYNAGVLIEAGSTDATTKLLSVESGGVNRFEVRGDGNVGIGTDSPSATLEINSSVGNQAKIRVGRQVGTSNYLELGTLGGESTITSIGTAAVNGTLIINRSTTTTSLETARFNADGNVGIGTTAPTSRLHVNGTGATHGEYFRISNGTTQIYELQPSIYNVTNNGFGIYDVTDSAYRLVIDTSGNVGIGTTAPGYKLEVEGASGTAISIKTPWAGGAYGQLRFQTGTGNSSIRSNVPGNSTNGLDFYTYSGSETVKMTILGSGNVGIGTTSPFSRFQVGNNTFAGANGMYQDARVGVSNHGSLTGMMLASTYNATTHPEYGLVFVQGPNTSSYNVWSISPDGPAKGDSLSFIYGAQATNIHDVTPKVVFDGNGNVGIGTTTPNNDKLHVETDTSTVYDGNSNQTGGLFVNNMYHEALNTFSQIRLGVSGASGASTVRLVGIEPSQAASDFAIVLRNGSVWGEKLRIKGATGNVGIGTITPRAKLEVVGDVTIQNGVYTYKAAGFAAGTTLLNFDINVGSEAGNGNVFKIEAGFAHYYAMTYNSIAEWWCTSRATNVVNTYILNAGTAFAGTWSSSKTNNSTLRVTKSAGTYGGGGKYWVKVTYVAY